MMVPTTGWMARRHDDGFERASTRCRGSQSGRSRIHLIRPSGRTNDRRRDGGTSTTKDYRGHRSGFQRFAWRCSCLENVRYMAARQLRSLSRGNALISYVGIDGWKGARVRVPRVQEVKRRVDGVASARRQYSMQVRRRCRRPKLKRRSRFASKRCRCRSRAQPGEWGKPVARGQSEATEKLQLQRNPELAGCGAEAKAEGKSKAASRRNNEARNARRLIAWQVTIRIWNYRLRRGHG